MRLKIPALIAILSAASPALAAQPFDGEWTMSAATREGTCAVYTFEVGIVDGRIQTPAGVAISGSGMVSPKGRVAVTFVAGSNTISASGQASKATASGRWEAPTLACSGSWSAQRR